MIRIDAARTRVTALVAISGNETSRKPYISHKVTPVQKMRYIPREISWVERVRQMRRAWGRKASVVQNPAAEPMISVLFTYFTFRYCRLS